MSSIGVSVCDRHSISIDELDDINVESLLRFGTIVIYNSSMDDNYIDLKSMDNISYANKCFRFVKELREIGYTGNIIVECDSLYDLGNSLFDYADTSYNTNFTDSLYTMDAINDFLNIYINTIEGINVSNMTKRELLIKILTFQVMELYNFVEEKSNLREEIRNKIHEYICSLFAYDLGKMLGIDFIKYSDEDTLVFYYFDNNSNKVCRYYPAEVLDKVVLYLNKKNYFADNEDDPKLLEEEVAKAYDEIVEKDELSRFDFDTIYSSLLDCNSIEEIYEVIVDEELDSYYKYLLNILMDLSLDDYNDFIKNSCSGNIKEDFNTLAELILSIKRKLTKSKIVMSYGHK